MPDIRSFFTPKGGAAPKPVAPKPEDSSKGKRASEFVHRNIHKIWVNWGQRVEKLSKTVMMRLK